MFSPDHFSTGEELLVACDRHEMTWACAKQPVKERGKNAKEIKKMSGQLISPSSRKGSELPTELVMGHVAFHVSVTCANLAQTDNDQT